MTDSLNENISEAQPWLKDDVAPLLSLRGVSKAFGHVKAVEAVDLDIYAGELFCLLGGSGSGKSTLLRLLAGFEDLSAGTIHLDGSDMSGVPANRRPMNMMFQSYALFPHMSVLNNVTYGLRHGGYGRSEARARAFEMLDLVKLTDLSDRRPHQLSGGQRQRVALARALAKAPKLLLLDEPLGALDKKLREETQFELIRIQETLGITFVVVTHDQQEAMTLATRIAVMRDGKLIQSGEPRKVYEYPNSRYVADFLGDVNLFEGRVIEDAVDHVVLDCPELGHIHVGHGVSCTLGQTLWVAVRPEKINFSKIIPSTSKAKKSSNENVTNAFTAEIDEIGYLGNVSVYLLRLPSGRIVKAMRTNQERDIEDTVIWGDTVRFNWGDSSGVVLVR